MEEVQRLWSSAARDAAEGLQEAVLRCRQVGIGGRTCSSDSAARSLACSGWGGDLEFMYALNAELTRRGQHACVVAWPESGHVPSKVERAQVFAPKIAAGLVHVRPEHVEFRRQAGLMSVAYLKAGGLVDCVDAGMGACMLALEVGGTAEVPALFGIELDDDWDEWDRPSRGRSIEDGWFGNIYSEVE